MLGLISDEIVSTYLSALADSISLGLFTYVLVTLLGDPAWRAE